VWKYAFLLFLSWRSIPSLGQWLLRLLVWVIFDWMICAESSIPFLNWKSVLKNSKDLVVSFNSPIQLGKTIGFVRRQHANRDQHRRQLRNKPVSPKFEQSTKSKRHQN
jgi:hypothetical protein